MDWDVGCTNVVSMAESGPLAVIEEMPSGKRGKYSWNWLSNDESKLDDHNEPT